MDLFETLTGLDCTCLVTSELVSSGSDRAIQLEEYLAHGVIMLRNTAVAGSLLREIQILKMRETDHDTQPRPYRITGSGIVVFPTEQVMR